VVALPLFGKTCLRVGEPDMARALAVIFAVAALFATPAQSFARGGHFGSGPGFGHPGFGRPGFGRPGFGRPAFFPSRGFVDRRFFPRGFIGGPGVIVAPYPYYPYPYPYPYYPAYPYYGAPSW
jgi:hypothetical protein